MEHITHAMRARHWAEIVKECNESGMKKKDWLDQHNINAKSYYRWQQKLRIQVGTDLILSEADKPTLDLAELKNSSPSRLESSVRIQKDGMIISLSDDIPDAMLIRIMKVLSNV